VEAWRLKLEPCMVYGTFVVDSHHFVEEQDPDPHQSDVDPQPWL